MLGVNSHGIILVTVAAWCTGNNTSATLSARYLTGFHVLFSCSALAVLVQQTDIFVVSNGETLYVTVLQGGIGTSF
jgi:hypothetical protein